ncbi:MAG: dihydrofolate reductase [Chthoniobacterales bacterium]|jgi:dihydrofolate reductase|nr:dihydrofolate reductase [Chthoniobacterales bacterium]
MTAVAAMAINRVIGADGKIPWHLPEDLRWFKELTTGGTLLMGRVTFESIGKPLPGRTTIVMSRQPGLVLPGVQVIRDLSALQNAETTGEIFVVGGAEIYRIALSYCRDLYLTEVNREAAGDRKFPVFEDLFRFSAVLRETGDLRIVHYVNDEVRPLPRTRLEAPP